MDDARKAALKRLMSPETNEYIMPTEEMIEAMPLAGGIATNISGNLSKGGLNLFKNLKGNLDKAGSIENLAKELVEKTGISPSKVQEFLDNLIYKGVGK